MFEKNSEMKYRVIASYRIDKNAGDQEMGPTWIKMAEEGEELFNESLAEMEIWAVIAGFYKNNEFFHQGDMVCAGISYSPMAENITVNGIPVCVERITGADGVRRYFWRVEVDLGENIQVEYTGK